MMNEKSNQMQVYVVIGGYDYEGCSFDSLKVFDCKSAAEEYKNHLQDQWNYDYVHMELKSVDMRSMIAA
jgi:hypothetical protein